MISPDRWYQVERLYHAALTRDDEDRAAFVRNACGSDEALRGELESLLAYSNAAPDFMAAPALEIAAAVMSPETVATSLVGRRVGPYEIRSLLGAGGMGDVYRARDITLGRDVAIKVLPEAFTADAERRARFEREARVLAALNHPHIGAIYGLENRDGIHGLLLELVDGQTLADRLREGSLPVGEAIAIASQIADALEAAHEKGIVHRDLKPANIGVTRDGIVKVLDFGLAKVQGDVASADMASPVGSPMHHGAVIGTTAYMSPEQARGKSVDRRTDLWAFGCVLYEMLAGRRAFDGGTSSDTIAAILEREPDWSVLPVTTPPSIRRLLHRCFEKDPKRRLRDAGDAQLDLDEHSEEQGVSEPVAMRRRPWRHLRIGWGAVAVLAVVVAVAGFSVRFRGRAASDEVIRFSVALPLNVGLLDLMTLSPDDRVLVYAGSDASTGRMLYRRTLDTLESVPIRGTAGGAEPFFSPDGASVGFFVDTTIKRIPLGGGIATDVAVGLDAGGGAVWLSDDTIVFESANQGLMRLSATGGEATRVTTIDKEHREVRHLFPAAVPGNRALLFTVYAGARDGSRIEVVSLETGQRTAVIAGSGARFLPSGRIVFERGGSLWVAPFDVDRLSLTGPATAVVEGVSVGPGLRGGWAPLVAVGSHGSLAYGIDADPFLPRTLVWVDKTGREMPVDAPARAWFYPQVSPDAKHLGLHIMDPVNMDAWIYDLDHGPLVRVTYDPRQDGYPLWTPDGHRIVFWSRQGGGAGNLYIRSADLSGGDERLTTSPNSQHPYSWADHGKLLVFEEQSQHTGYDIGVVPIDGAHQARLIIRGPSHEQHPSMSPDGRWIAYDSNLTGRPEIYVQPFPSLQSRSQISTEGGGSPLWSPTGKEIFYRRGSAVMSVPVETRGPAFEYRNSRMLFEGSYVEEDNDGRPSGISYAVAPDGQRFLMMREQERRATQIIVIRNWLSEVERRLAH